MWAFWRTIARSHVIKRIVIESLTAPVHLNLLSLLVAVFGTYRARIAFDLIIRQQHAHGLLRAAQVAKALGLPLVTVVEMGVGGGAGLMNLAHIALKLTRRYGVEFDVVGLDTGKGMPAPRDFRDHPELYAKGLFAMDVGKLKAALPTNARLILGDLSDTIPEFVKTLSPGAPLAFATLDVDYYWSSKIALEVFTGDPLGYLPLVPVYVDDLHMPNHNPACGELLAIDEFNQEHERRKLFPDRFLRHKRVFKNAEWIDHMYYLHVLDHPRRNTIRDAKASNVMNPYL